MSENLIMGNNAIVIRAEGIDKTIKKITLDGFNKLFIPSNNPELGVMICGTSYFGSIELDIDILKNILVKYFLIQALKL